MTAKALDVYWGEDELPIGQITKTDAGTSFRYEVRTPPRRRISHSLPVDDARSYDITFFENLLPDGVQRERLARSLGVSDSSAFEMLSAIGGDCAGALSLVLEGESRLPEGAEDRLLDAELFERIMLVGAGPAAIREGVRLSLAGAQDKLPVLLKGDEIYLPGGRSASSHILKLPSREFPGLCANEHFILSLAQAVGLRCAKSRCIELFGETALLIERFDRDSGQRLHQEDVCQALGRMPSRKYEAEGGPSLLDVVALLTEASTEPDDIFSLVKWQAFNIAVGNNDGHNKNISLLREPTVRLAPAYDLVCTRAWSKLNRSLAFSVGGIRDAGNVGAHAWRKLAKEASLAERAVLRTVEQVTDAILDKMDAVARHVIDVDRVDATATRIALEQVREMSARARKLLKVEK